MTHNELLKDIDDQEYAYDNLAEALRAVVELHYEDIGTPIDDPISVCDWCKVAYPCPTIQAIEKELN
jgi:hypothetical protein